MEASIEHKWTRHRDQEIAGPLAPVTASEAQRASVGERTDRVIESEYQDVCRETVSSRNSCINKSRTYKNIKRHVNMEGDCQGVPP